MRMDLIIRVQSNLFKNEHFFWEIKRKIDLNNMRMDLIIINMDYICISIFQKEKKN